MGNPRGGTVERQRNARSRGAGAKGRRDIAAPLQRAVEKRFVTFVLGAGVSKSRGVPEWRELTRLLFGQFLGAKQIPPWLRDESAALGRVRAWVEKSEGADIARRLCLTTPHPFADQMALELLKLQIGKRGETTFVERLRRALYAAPRRNAAPGETLAVLARILVDEQAALRRRVLRVITFNADDHLEVEANRGHNPMRDPILWPIARESGHPRTSRGANGKAPIPVYHVHGFLPREGSTRWWRDAPDTLVFTDSEYWATVASPITFANRVFAQALHDSSCIFIGVSMHDMNLMRWLGMRYNAIRDDKLAQSALLDPARERSAVGDRIRDALARHFWVRPDDTDPDRLITDLLQERGVSPVPIAGWGAPFERLMDACFGLSRPATR